MQMLAVELGTLSSPPVQVVFASHRPRYSWGSDIDKQRIWIRLDEGIFL